MKASEFEKQRREYWNSRDLCNPPTQQVVRDRLAAEAAGVKWDPEDLPPFPARIVVNTTGLPPEIVELLPGGSLSLLGIREMREVCYRYNMWAKVSEVVDSLYREGFTTAAERIEQIMKHADEP
jgi:hypothetical protein